MKLGIIAPGYPYRGGISHFATRLAQELSQSQECTYFNFSRLYPDLLFPGKTQLDESSTAYSFPSERIIDSISPHSWKQTGKTISEKGVETLIFHWWHPFFAPAYRGIIRSLDKNINKICICHNVAPHEQSAFRRKFVKSGLKKMDGFIVHAAQEANELLDILPYSRSMTLFHPVYDIFSGEDEPKSQARIKLDLHDDDRVVLYFGLIRPYKGVEVLLKAISLIADLPRLKLLVVGEIYSDRDDIQKLIGKLPPGLVRLVDRYVPNEEVSSWFRAADLVALPYLSATQSGIIPIALRCNRPVVVTNVGGLPEMVDDGKSGYLVNPDNPDELAAAIRNHFIERDNPDMSQGIESMRNRLSWENYVSRLLWFIQEQRGSLRSVN
ncbi:MAG: glycosyltransferase [Calditrichaeota bacterium]|nr:glycosyltransferase [Calditrichota bacterium]